MTERLLSGNVEIAPRDQRGHGEYTAAQSFADDHHVGNDVVTLEGEHASRAAEANRNLIEDQQRAMAVARKPQPLVILR